MKTMNNQPPKLHLREKLSILFFFLFFCLAIVQLFRPDPMDYYNTKASEIKLSKELKEKVQHEKLIYQKKLDSLSSINDSLSSYIKKVDTELVLARHKNTSLKVQLSSTIASYKNDSTKIKDAAAFDSLAGLSKVYIVETEKQDSLCQLEISLLKEQMENRDTTISFCQNQVEVLEQDFFLLSKSHERLTEQLSFTEKKLKRQTFKKRFYQGAVLVIAGVCTTFYLTHH